MDESIASKSQKRLSLFHRWLDENHVAVHPGVQIVDKPDSGIAVVTRSPDIPILHPDRLAVIPKSSILSVKNCALAPWVPFYPYGHDASLALSLALYSEQLLGSDSRWHGYLQSLPSTTVPIARLWGHTSAFPDLDAADAARCLHGTEVQRELQNDEGTSLTDEIDNFYHSEAHPVLKAANFQPTLAGFLHAYSLVCSRAFLVDAYHGLSMVPVADAFNHAHHNHVQLASEYDVCPACGSLSECAHDRQPEGPATDREEDSGPVPPSIDPTDTVDMVTVCSVPPGVEVFNTYGATLGNAALLARYGFVLDGGETDTVTFGWHGSSLELELERGSQRWENAYTEARNSVEAVVSGSSLVYVPESDTERSLALSINSDGQVSVALFVWAVMDALPQEPPHVQAYLVLRVCSALVHFEALRDADEDEDAPTRDQSHDPEAERVLMSAANMLKRLCHNRAANIGAEGYRRAGLEVLVDVLDNLPEDRTKTRLALEYLLSERAILGACAAGWEDMERTIVPGAGSTTSDEDMV